MLEWKGKDKGGLSMTGWRYGNGILVGFYGEDETTGVVVREPATVLEFDKAILEGSDSVLIRERGEKLYYWILSGDPRLESCLMRVQAKDL